MLSLLPAFFGLPLTTRLKIIVGDGRRYVHKTAFADKQFDLLFIDAFICDGLSPQISGHAFFDACRAVLSRQGILIINLWNNDKALFEQIALTLSQSFDDQVLFLSVQNKGNVIVFCFADRLPQISAKRLRERAGQMRALSGMEYDIFARDLIRYNPFLLQQLHRL